MVSVTNNNILALQSSNQADLQLIKDINSGTALVTNADGQSVSSQDKSITPEMRNTLLSDARLRIADRDNDIANNNMENTLRNKRATLTSAAARESNQQIG